MKISADYRLCLNAIFYDNPSLILAILEMFPQQDLMIKGIDSFLRSRGFKDKNRQRYLSAIDSFNGDQFKEKLSRLKINVVFRGDEYYPVLLNEIHDPPDLLYYKRRS